MILGKLMFMVLLLKIVLLLLLQDVAVKVTFGIEAMAVLFELNYCVSGLAK